MKHKRKNDQVCDWAASVANVGLVLAVVLCFAGASGSHMLAGMQQAIAGFTMLALVILSTGSCVTEALRY